jgi:aminodeoxyfutalosine deaminase
MSLESYLRAAPKAELHVHLEGSIRPDVLLRLARRNSVELPYDTPEGLRQWFTFRDFAHFIEIYLAITRCLRTEEDYAEIAYEHGADMARQHIRYAEVTFSPSTHWLLGIPHDVYFAGLTRGRERAQAELGVEIAWVFDIVRNISDPTRTQSAADYTTSVAIEDRAHGVVSLGLGGMEHGYPPEPFAPYFDRARAVGLHSDPHSGETAGPESVWGAIRALRAERIGHGVRSIEDPALVAYLVEHQLPLEVNPTSNIRLGVYHGYDEHPLLRLYEAGVPLTVNSDDGPLFNTTLTDEVLLLASQFGLDLPQLDELLLNGVRHSFLPPERKLALEREHRAQLDTLKREHGLA